VSEEEKVGVGDSLTITLRDEDGEIKQEETPDE
jgi:hypothetical protein